MRPPIRRAAPSAHIRALSLSTARVGAPTIFTVAVFTHLEVLASGTRIAILSIDSELLDGVRA